MPMIISALLVAATLSASDRAALENTVAEIFRPYSAEENSTAAWDYPIYSAGMTDLIAKWRTVTPSDEPDELSDGDWLCQCQDWNSQAFRATIERIDMAGQNEAVVDVRVDLGFGGEESIRGQRLIFKREGGAWKLDDLADLETPNGLKSELARLIGLEVTDRH